MGYRNACLGRGKLSVTEVRGKADVQHFVGDDHGLSVGDTVDGEIDWDRRHAHAMHTAQHLVSGLVYELYDGARTVAAKFMQIGHG